MPKPSLEDIFSKPSVAGQGEKQSLSEIFGEEESPLSRFSPEDIARAQAKKKEQDIIAEQNTPLREAGAWLESGRDVARRAAQGATFGFADETEAAFRAANDPRGPQTYREHLDKIREENAQAKLEQGMAGSALELASSLPAGGIGAKAAMGAATLGGKALRMGTQSAAQSGAYGAGVAEGDIENVAKAAGLSAAVGAPLGAVLGSAGAAGASLKKAIAESPITASIGNLLPFASGVGRTIRGAEDLLKRSSLFGAPLRSTEKKTLGEGRKIIEDLSEGTPSYEQIGKEIQGGLGEKVAKAGREVDEAYAGGRAIVGDEKQIAAPAEMGLSKIDEMLNSKSLSSGQARALQKIRNDLSSREYDVAGLRNAKSEVYDRLDPDKTKLTGMQRKEIYDALKQDQYNAIKRAGDEVGGLGEEAVQAFKKGDELYSKKIGKYEDTIVEKLLDKEKSAQVSSELLKSTSMGKGGNIEGLKSVLDELPEETKKSISAQLAKAQLIPAGKQIDDLTAGQVEKAFSKMSPEAKTLLFGGKEAEMAGVADVFKRVGEKKLVPSGTPSGMLDIGAAGVGFSAAPGLFGSEEEQAKSIERLGKAGAVGGGALTIAALLSNPKLAARMLSSAGAARRLLPYALSPREEMAKQMTGER